MLWDCIQRSPLADKVDVVAGDACAWLAGLTGERPEVVYLDPMFQGPGRAQVKQEMQVLRALCGPPEDAGALFAAARAAASERVVVKRHPDDPPLGGPPSFTVAASRVRFDVYLTARA
jgi:16S rRNA (guanine1516-N2)-methyltransferase